ncbi:MAG TPA: hypothetical protein VK473_04600 [Terriglobales bacterium]|nr:hypothetical protein [Terriglobales bacterium]
MKFFFARPCQIFLLTIAAANLAAQASPTAQQPPAADSSPSPQTSPEQSKEHRDLQKQQQTGTSNDRLFYTLPNFLTVETKDVPPLTAGQKFKVVTRGSFDYIQIPW